MQRERASGRGRTANGRAQGEIRMQKWHKVGIAIVAILVAFGGWELAHPDALPPSVPTAFHSESGTVTDQAYFASIAAPQTHRPTAPVDQSAIETFALTGAMSLTPR